MKHTQFKNKYRVESARLPGWDYSQPGWYFVTICTRDRLCFFGDVVDGKMRLSPIGESVCTKRIRAAGHTNFGWQSRFYDRIIRDQMALTRTRQYIRNNPGNVFM